MSEPFHVSKEQFAELMALKGKLEGNAGGENFAAKGLSSIGSAAQSEVDFQREVFADYLVVRERMLRLFGRLAAAAVLAAFTLCVLPFLVAWVLTVMAQR